MTSVKATVVYGRKSIRPEALVTMTYDPTIVIIVRSDANAIRTGAIIGGAIGAAIGAAAGG